jgi:hypothetical protein
LADQRPILDPEPATQRDEPETVGIRQIRPAAVLNDRPLSGNSVLLDWVSVNWLGAEEPAVRPSLRPAIKYFLAR